MSPSSPNAASFHTVEVLNCCRDSSEFLRSCADKGATTRGHQLSLSNSWSRPLTHSTVYASLQCAAPRGILCVHAMIFRFSGTAHIPLLANPRPGCSHRLREYGALRLLEGESVRPEEGCRHRRPAAVHIWFIPQPQTASGHVCFPREHSRVSGLF